jgi:subtilisin-like proprotein convertase family protein
MGQAGTTLFFRKDAKFSNPGTMDNIPVSPVNRRDISNFPASWQLSGYMNDRIPGSGFSGTITSDLQVTAAPGTIINDINFYAAINHSKEQDLDMWLVSPSGDTCKVFSSQNQLGSNDNIIAVFDDQADSSLISGKFTSFGPVIKPYSNMNSEFQGSSPDGNWKLIITDDGAASDTGYVYCWGIQINNGSTINSTSNNGINTPGNFKLSQNYPNPFNPATRINFSVAETGNIKLTVYDILGKEVSVLVNKTLNPGEYNIEFNAGELTSGVYFYRLEADSFSDIKKMILVK